MNRRQLLTAGGSALLGAAVAGRLFAAPTTGPRFLLVFLRGGYDSSQSAHPLFEQLLLRGAPEYRHRPARRGLEHRRARAGCRLGARARGARHHRRDVPASARSPSSRSPAPMICRAATSKPRTASNSASPPSGARNYRSGFLGRLSDTLLGSSTQRAADRLHRCAAARLPRRGDGAEPLAQECRQAAVR